MAGLSGPQLQERLSKMGYRLPIVFLTGHGDVATSVQAMKAGAEDSLIKPAAKKDLLIAIGRALDRYEEMRDQDNRLAALRSRLSGLTPRESEVFLLVVRGKLNKQIAHELGTSERTSKRTDRRSWRNARFNRWPSWS
jgi:FixJ family two-component response regulator